MKRLEEGEAQGNIAFITPADMHSMDSTFILIYLLFHSPAAKTTGCICALLHNGEMKVSVKMALQSSICRI
jgi:hypothetical protein